MDDASARRKIYVAYLLRLWQAGGQDGQPVWHASLEDPHSGELLAFGDLRALFAFLSERTSVLAETGEAAQPYSQQSDPL